MKIRFVSLLLLAGLPLLAEAPPATVKLPLSDYRKLREAADETARHPKPQPVSPALESAKLSVVPGEESAELTSRLELNVPAAGNWKLPIPGAGKLASWSSTPPGCGIVSENGGRFLVAGKPGRCVVTSVEALPLSPLDGYSRCAIAAPAASSVALTVRVATADEDVRLSEGALSRQPGNVFAGTIPRGKTVALDFRARETEAEAARLTSVRLDLITLSGERPSREGVADISVLAGRVATLALLLPASESVDSVSGDGVAGFARDSKKPERVLVTFLPPARGRVRLYWKSTLAADGALVPASIEGEDGGESYLAASADRGREIEAKENPGLDRADPKDLPPLLNALLPEQAALLFRVAPGGKEHVLVARTKAFSEAAGKDAVIERATATSVLTRDGARLDRILATVKTKNSSLPWPLPAGTTIWSVFVNGKPVKPSGDGLDTRIPLRGALGSAELDVVLSRPGVKIEKRGEAELELPALPEPLLSLSWNLYLPDGKRYRLKGGNLWEASLSQEAGRSYVDFDSFQETARKAAPAPTPAPSIAFAPNGGVTGAIYGHVEDDQGGRLPGVSVTLTGCGPTLQSTTDTGGDFYFLNLAPCRYQVKSELPGFVTIERTNIDVRAGGETRVRETMRVASIATTVTVTSESPLLDTRKATSGSTFSGSELSDSRGVEGGVLGGVPGGVVGGVSGGAKSQAKREKDERERQRVSNAALVAQQVQQGLKSLPIEVPSEGKLFMVEGRLFFGEAPRVTIEYKD